MFRVEDVATMVKICQNLCTVVRMEQGESTAVVWNGFMAILLFKRDVVQRAWFGGATREIGETTLRQGDGGGAVEQDITFEKLLVGGPPTPGNAILLF